MLISTFVAINQVENILHASREWLYLCCCLVDFSKSFKYEVPLGSGCCQRIRQTINTAIHSKPDKDLQMSNLLGYTKKANKKFYTDCIYICFYSDGLDRIKLPLPVPSQYNASNPRIMHVKCARTEGPSGFDLPPVDGMVGSFWSVKWSDLF